MLEPKRHVMTWNLAAQRVKGYAPDEGVGLCWLSVWRFLRARVLAQHMPMTVPNQVDTAQGVDCLHRANALAAQKRRSTMAVYDNV
jgi:hypothetical protein